MTPLQKLTREQNYAKLRLRGSLAALFAAQQQLIADDSCTAHALRTAEHYMRDALMLWDDDAKKKREQVRRYAEVTDA